MATMKIEDGKVRPMSEAEENALGTLPGAYAKHLANQYGLAKYFPPVKAYYVDAVTEKVTTISIVQIVGSGLEFVGPAAYVLTANGLRLPSLYIFPKAKHLKPRLATVKDEYGDCRQWVAPLKANAMGPW